VNGVEFYFGEQIGAVSAEPHDCGLCGHPSLVFVNRDGRTGCLDCAGVIERPYCIDCGEYFDARPLDGGGEVLLALFHAQAGHQVVMRKEARK
jgi:hypothetical protein